jgi:glycosyltransferase involved in cell wall biosynthesis
MPVRNNESSVAKSIESICNQTFENFEFLIIDDFSSDSTYEIIKEYEKKDNRLKIFKNTENIGLTKSLNKLISLSKGSIIARQDGDDISSRHRFSKQSHYFESSDYDFCLTRATTLPGGKVRPNYSYYLPAKLVSRFKNPFIHGTLMIRKRTLLQIGSYNENFYYAQDFKLFKDLLNRNKKFKYIKEPLYRLNTQNNISTYKKIEQKFYSDSIKRNQHPTKFIK